MTFKVNLQELRERASKRVATLANAANRLPADVSQLAALATVAGVEEHSQAWTDEDIARFLSRRDRLLRWGWTEADAERLAERLVIRDREQDDRGSCSECHHGRARTCPDGSPLPIELLHRCAGFAP